MSEAIEEHQNRIRDIIQSSSYEQTEFTVETPQTPILAGLDFGTQMSTTSSNIDPGACMVFDVSDMSDISDMEEVEKKYSISSPHDEVIQRGFPPVETPVEMTSQLSLVNGDINTPASAKPHQSFSQESSVELVLETSPDKDIKSSTQEETLPLQDSERSLKAESPTTLVESRPILSSGTKGSLDTGFESPGKDQCHDLKTLFSDKPIVGERSEELPIDGVTSMASDLKQRAPSKMGKMPIASAQNKPLPEHSDDEDQFLEDIGVVKVAPKSKAQPNLPSVPSSFHQRGGLVEIGKNCQSGTEMQPLSSLEFRKDSPTNNGQEVAVASVTQTSRSRTSSTTSTDKATEETQPESFNSSPFAKSVDSQKLEPLKEITRDLPTDTRESPSIASGSFDASKSLSLIHI